MEVQVKKSKSKSEVPRKRGRPSGKNRVPLTREERRARNAQYERERRNETAAAMAQLAQAAGCDPSISIGDLLATALTMIKNATQTDNDLERLKRINKNLTSQLQTLQERVASDAETMESGSSDSTSQLEPPNKKRKIKNEEPQHASTSQSVTSECMDQTSSDMSNDAVKVEQQECVTPPTQVESQSSSSEETSTEYSSDVNPETRTPEICTLTWEALFPPELMYEELDWFEDIPSLIE